MNEMPYDWFLLDFLANLRFDLAIAPGKAVMLPEVLGPRRHEKRLQVHIRVLEITKHTPPRRSVAVSDPAQLLYRAEKLMGVLWLDAVTHRHQRGAMRERRRRFVDDGGHPPMVPGRHVRRHLWQLSNGGEQNRCHRAHPGDE